MDKLIPNKLTANALIGENLRILLNSNHISYGVIHSTLKAKGLYVGTNSKEFTIPLLVSTILTPEEFNNLIEISIDKESKPKTKSSTINLISADNNWMKYIDNEVVIPNISLDSMNIDFKRKPTVTKKNNIIEINYAIIKKDYSKDWIQRETEFNGKITISQANDSTLSLDFSSSYTSNETNTINYHIQKNIALALKQNGISQEAELNTIKFNSFLNNQERIKFFKRLTAGINKFLVLENVNSLEISLDNTAPPLPDDPKVAWMKTGVKKMIVDGTQLNNLFMISEAQFSQYYHIHKMDMTYKYKNKLQTGSCEISFFFSKPHNSSNNYSNHELTFSCSGIKITKKGKITIEEKNSAYKFTNQKIRELIDLKFNEILKERKSTDNKPIEK